MNCAELQRAHVDVIRVRRVAGRVFRGYTGRLGVRLWDGIVISLKRDNPVATVVVRTAKPLRELASRPDPLRRAEAYFFGEVDVGDDLDALSSSPMENSTARVTFSA